jgi:hypothetical protein
MVFALFGLGAGAALFAAGMAAMVWVAHPARWRDPAGSLVTWNIEGTSAPRYGFRIRNFRIDSGELETTPPRQLLMHLGGWSSLSMVLRYAHVNVAHAAPSIATMPTIGCLIIAGIGLAMTTPGM